MPRDLESVANLFGGTPSRPVTAPNTVADVVRPAAPKPARRSTPRTRREAEPLTPTAIESRVYASLPFDDVAQVRAIAKARGWSLLSVAAAALEAYTPALYDAERGERHANPLPGSKTKMRHGDTYLQMSVNNAAQREWLDTTLAPYEAESVAHVLGCALSHYLTTITHEA